MVGVAYTRRQHKPHCHPSRATVHAAIMALISKSLKEHSLDLGAEDVGDADVAVSVLVTTTVGAFPGDASEFVEDGSAAEEELSSAVVIDVLVSGFGEGELGGDDVKDFDRLVRVG